jgi:hypothetical protein
MPSHSSDVSPATAALLVDHWRTAPPWQKLAYVHELNETLKLLALSDLRRRHPTESEAQLQRRLATRWLGAELAERVYGPITEGADAAR